uniref:DNA ligase 1-like n=1 Tax=Caenorhabditis tropicalis TaxID=1561998 RepID=A0A1I7SYL1_9PELO
MGRSKSKSNSRSISKWRKFFTSGSKQVDPSVEEPQTTAISASPASNNSFSGAPKSRSNSISGVPRRRSTGTREDGTGPLKTMEEPPSIGTGASKSSTLEKKEEKKEIKEEVKKEEIKKESGSKCEEAPSKNAKKKEVKKEEQEASVFEEVQGPAAPAQTGTHGIKNKMR